MENVKTHLSELNYPELTELLESNQKLFFELKELADEYCTQYAVDELGAGIPWNSVEDVGYCGTYDFVLAKRITPDYVKVADWLDGLNHNFCIFDDSDGLADVFPKVRKYAEVMHDSDYGYISTTEKDYRFMEDFCDNELDRLLGKFSSYLNDVQNQFFEESELADYLMNATEILGRYYIDERKNVWVELPDRKVG